MFRPGKPVALFLLFLALIFLISGIFVPLCFAQEVEDPPPEEEKPVFVQMQESLNKYLQLMGDGEVEEAFAVLEEYLAELEELAEDPAGLTEVEAHAAHVLYVTSKHLAVLMRVYEKAPEAAHPGIANALMKGTKGHANAYRLTQKAGEEETDEDEEAEESETAEEEGNSQNGQNGQGKGNNKEKKENKDKP